VTSSKALGDLLHFLTERNVQSKGMTLARGSGWLIPESGHPIGYWHGFYWWPCGRVREGRPVFAIHPASDPEGAARRIAAARQSPQAVSR
jgi:hypothetical protein